MGRGDRINAMFQRILMAGVEINDDTSGSDFEVSQAGTAVEADSDTSSSCISVQGEEAALSEASSGEDKHERVTHVDRPAAGPSVTITIDKDGRIVSSQTHPGRADGKNAPVLLRPHDKEPSDPSRPSEREHINVDYGDESISVPLSSGEELESMAPEDAQPCSQSQEPEGRKARAAAPEKRSRPHKQRISITDWTDYLATCAAWNKLCLKEHDNSIREEAQTSNRDRRTEAEQGSRVLSRFYVSASSKDRLFQAILETYFGAARSRFLFDGIRRGLNDQDILSLSPDASSLLFGVEYKGILEAYQIDVDNPSIIISCEKYFKHKDSLSRLRLSFDAASGAFILSDLRCISYVSSYSFGVHSLLGQQTSGAISSPWPQSSFGPVRSFPSNGQGRSSLAGAVSRQLTASILMCAALDVHSSAASGFVQMIGSRLVERTVQATGPSSPCALHASSRMKVRRSYFFDSAHVLLYAETVSVDLLEEGPVRTPSNVALKHETEDTVGSRDNPAPAEAQGELPNSEGGDAHTNSSADHQPELKREQPEDQHAHQEPRKRGTCDPAPTDAKPGASLSPEPEPDAAKPTRGSYQKVATRKAPIQPVIPDFRKMSDKELDSIPCKVVDSIVIVIDGVRHQIHELSLSLFRAKCQSSAHIDLKRGKGRTPIKFEVLLSIYNTYRKSGQGLCGTDPAVSEDHLHSHKAPATSMEQHPVEKTKVDSLARKIAPTEDTVVKKKVRTTRKLTDQLMKPSYVDEKYAYDVSRLASADVLTRLRMPLESMDVYTYQGALAERRLSKENVIVDVPAIRFVPLRNYSGVFEAYVEVCSKHQFTMPNYESTQEFGFQPLPVSEKIANRGNNRIRDLTIANPYSVTSYRDLYDLGKSSAYTDPLTGCQFSTIEEFSALRRDYAVNRPQGLSSTSETEKPDAVNSLNIVLHDSPEKCSIVQIGSEHNVAPRAPPSDISRDFDTMLLDGMDLDCIDDKVLEFVSSVLVI